MNCRSFDSKGKKNNNCFNNSQKFNKSGKYFRLALVIIIRPHFNDLYLVFVRRVVL
jgi:hypothetical protein